MSTVANGRPESQYEKGVGRIANYLRGLPDLGREMWLDAAYQIHVEKSLEDDEA